MIVCCIKLRVTKFLCLIFYQIKPSLVDEAVARTARFNSREEEPVNSIKLITRLNGQHEHKWKINRANPLSKVFVISLIVNIFCR